jgi:alkylation response protein AidB-like acyl-CoA dehydrogenase
MDFGLSDEQRLLEASVRRYLEEAAPISRVREIANGEGFDRDLWTGLAELGVAGALVPELYGGSELSLLDAAIVAESLAHGAAPAPFLGTSVLAPLALRLAGDEITQKEWLPRIAAGELVVGIALTEVVGRREAAGLTLEGGSLRGKALFVLDAPSADLFLVAAGSEGLALVGADQVQVEALKTIDRTRRVGELVADGATPLAELGGATGAAAVIDRLLDAARIMLAADTLGAAERMLELAVEYAGQRSQFGRVIASFQAVKHMCAEMLAELEPARSLVWYAAHAFDELPEEASLVASHAKAHLSDVGTHIAKLATEVHGGVGFTDEQNLHVWFKRISFNRQLFGGPELLRERAATLQGWSDAQA